MTVLTDEELALRFTEGDASAFEQLVQRYKDKTYSLAYWFVGNQEDAFDMAQEAMVRVHRYLPQFKGNIGFSIWFYRIVCGVCLDEVKRRKSRIIPLPTDELFLAARDTGERAAGESGGSYEPGELFRKIHATLSQVTLEHRAVIILRDVMRFSCQDVASILQLSIGTVKSRLNRGRSILKRVLVDHQE